MSDRDTGDAGEAGSREHGEDVPSDPGESVGGSGRRSGRPRRSPHLPRMLVTGGRGQLGVDLSSHADAPGREELDITDPASIVAVLDRYAPETVINAAAYTDVDGAESDEAAARAVNSDGARSLAVVCRDRGIRLIHLSTDYVFSGTVPRDGDPATAPGLEPHDPTDPTTAYGRTKLAGERAVLAEYPEATVVRTAWVYTGAWRVIRDQPGSDFVATMIRLESERETIRVVDDQWGSPTYVSCLAGGLLELLSAEKSGSVDARGRILHLAGGGRTTWFGLARTVFQLLGEDPERVQPCSTEEFPRPAPRPEFSVLSDASWRELGLTPLQCWRDDLRPGLAFLASARDAPSGP